MKTGMNWADAWQTAERAELSESLFCLPLSGLLKFERIGQDLTVTASEVLAASATLNVLLQWSWFLRCYSAIRSQASEKWLCVLISVISI